ncbi:MAG: hypothetical protein D6798_16205 [Deltaproteobacteria bacterium]|nr:MAG: hypothetical protein D6798_16205 [Deltaproteobacteria bacterium]
MSAPPRASPRRLGRILVDRRREELLPGRAKPARGGGGVVGRLRRRVAEGGPAHDQGPLEADCKAEVDKRRADADDEVSDEQAYTWRLDARRRQRDARSRPLIERLDQWRQDVVRLDGTVLAEAVDHLDCPWTRLLLFLDDPRIPMDNGHAERQIGGPVVGRKNYAGNRSEAGARVAALFFSLIGTARNRGVDPHDYLVTAATRARENLGSVFTPWDYAEALADKAHRQDAATTDSGKPGPGDGAPTD